MAVLPSTTIIGLKIAARHSVLGLREHGFSQRSRDILALLPFIATPGCLPHIVTSLSGRCASLFNCFMSPGLMRGFFSYQSRSLGEQVATLMPFNAIRENDCGQ